MAVYCFPKCIQNSRVLANVGRKEYCIQLRFRRMFEVRKIHYPKKKIVSKRASRIIEEGIENVEKPKSSSRIGVVKIASTQSSSTRESFYNL